MRWRALAHRSARRSRRSLRACIAGGFSHSGSGTDSAGDLLNVLHVDVSVRGIHDPSYRLFDLTRGLWHAMIQQPIKLYPYVEIILGKTRVSTDCCQTVTHGSATFERSHVCIMLPVSDYLCRGGETRKMTLRVFNRRWGVSLRGDPLIGEVELPIDMSRACGQESFVCVPISRRGRPHGQILVKYSVASAAESAYEDKLHETGQHSVSEVAEALAQVLQGKNGLNIVRAALPKELVPPQTNAQPGHSSHDPLQALLVSLCNQASMLADESDDEVLERFGRLSRSIQDFVAKYASSGAEVTSLAKLWIRRIFNGCGSSKETLCMKSFLPQLNSLDEDRLRKFIENGKRFPGINDLAPIDRCGNEIKDWRLFAPDVPQLAILGEGSFGYVWRAKDTRSGEWYAVKNSRKPRSRFVQREIAVTDHVLMRPHPCIVQIFGTHYLDSVQRSSLIMEFCTGGDLLHEIQRWVLNSPGRYRPPLVAPFYLAQVILGLEHLHTKLDTLLRDLKPENVLLDSPRADAVVKVADFGLATELGFEGYHPEESMRLKESKQLKGGFCGSPICMAPEVAHRNAMYGPQCDIWSVGCMTHELVSGKPPFTAANAKLLFKTIREKKQPSFDAQVWDEISEKGRLIVTWMLQFEPKDRPSAKEALSHSWFGQAPNDHLRATHDVHKTRRTAWREEFDDDEHEDLYNTLDGQPNLADLYGRRESGPLSGGLSPKAH
mmetsp:Transcript_81466/g.141125  ORF Transcript_81466/g.141125 Transcript_81466/m.141125 type:complete len:720 (+) Transcript_81466:236-2395(+)